MERIRCVTPHTLKSNAHQQERALDEQADVAARIALERPCEILRVELRGQLRTLLQKHCRQHFLALRRIRPAKTDNMLCNNALAKRLVQRLKARTGETVRY